MIKRANSMVSEFCEREQGGKGTVEIMHIYKPEELSGNSKLCAVIKINPGCSIGYHQHVGEEEVFFVIHGEALIVDDGVNEVIGAGDSHLIKSGSYHSIENIGTGLLEVVALIHPYH